MTEDHSRLNNLEPLGKSVEEIEQDSQNRVNPPALEQPAVGGTLPAVPPINSTGTWSSQTGIGASTPEVPVGPTRSTVDND